MNTLGKVCVGFDGSPGAGQALNWALRLAKGRGGRVVPVAAWDYPMAMYSPVPVGAVVPAAQDIERAATAASTSHLERWSAAADADPADHLDALVVVQGSAGSTLVKQSADADLLVVGARGLNPIKAFLLGSVSGYCAAHASCPVAIIPTSAPDRAVKRIVVGHDDSEQADAAVEWAIDHYPGSSIEIVHVWRAHLPMEPYGYEIDPAIVLSGAQTLVELAVRRFDDQAVEQGCTLSGLAVEGDPRSVLPEHAADAQLLVLGVQHAHGLGRLFMGSVAQSIIHHLAGPTVIVPVARDNGT